MQIQLPIRDLLFINYAVSLESIRPIVPEEFDVETIVDPNGKQIAFVSVVPFKVVDLHSTMLPMPRLSFEQINYRTYVKTGGAPAVYFFDMRVSSRMVSTMAAFLGLPINYEEIQIAVGHAGDDRVEEPVADTAPVNPEGMTYVVRSTGAQGLTAEAVIEGRHDSLGPQDRAVTPEFFTERPLGFVRAAAGSIFKIEVEHAPMRAILARKELARARLLESLGVLNMDQSQEPHSILYVQETVFNTNPPGPWVPEDRI